MTLYKVLGRREKLPRAGWSIYFRGPAAFRQTAESSGIARIKRDARTCIFGLDDITSDHHMVPAPFFKRPVEGRPAKCER